jgi:hypothetical protein
VTVAGSLSPVPWRVAGSYFEACSCQAICPCRRVGDRAGGRSTYGTCDFALSWVVTTGHAGTTDLSGLGVVLAGSYDDDEPGSPWRVAFYIDERAEHDQHEALTAIFLGRAGGTTLRNFAAAIGEVYAVRPARITLQHTAGRERIDVEDVVTVAALTLAPTDAPVSCGIPGHDHPGQEVVTGDFRVDDPPLRWEVSGRCGFVGDFDYTS